jgi:ribosomal-protein-serine acetyltransferase
MEKCIAFSTPSGNLSLTPVSKLHSEPLYQLTMQEKPRLRATLPWLDSVQQPQDTMHFIEDSISLWQQGKSRRYAITPAVESAEGSQLPGQHVGQHSLMGMIAVDDLDTEAPRVGYWLAGGWEGKGIMTAAVQALATHAFATSTATQLYIRAAVGNTASKRVAQKAGFQRVGTKEKEVWLYGTWIDMDVFCLAKDGHISA